MRPNHKIATLNIVEGKRISMILMDVKVLRSGVSVELVSDKMLKITGEDLTSDGRFTPKIENYSLSKFTPNERAMLDEVFKGIQKIYSSAEEYDEITVSDFKGYCYVKSEDGGSITPLIHNVGEYIKNMDAEKLDSTIHMARLVDFCISNSKLVRYILDGSFRKKLIGGDDVSNRRCVVYTRAMFDSVITMIIPIKLVDDEFICPNNDVIHLLCSSMGVSEIDIKSTYFTYDNMTDLHKSLSYTTDIVETALTKVSDAFKNDSDILNHDMILISDISILSPKLHKLTGLDDTLGKYVDIFDKVVADRNDIEFQSAIIDILSTSKTDYIINTNLSLIEARENVTAMMEMVANSKKSKMC